MILTRDSITFGNSSSGSCIPTKRGSLNLFPPLLLCGVADSHGEPLVQSIGVYSPFCTEIERTTSLLFIHSSLMTSTDDGYKKFCSSHGCAQDTVVLADGTRGHWIGDKSAEKVMFFCHGKCLSL